jgi:hypothetical protein
MNPRVCIGTIVDHVLAESKEKKTPSVRLKLTWAETEPAHLFWDGWLSEKAIPSTIKTLREALGWTGNDLRDFNGTEQFAGVAVKMLVEDEEWNNKLRPKVQFIAHVDADDSQLSRGQLIKMDDDAATRLAGLLQDAVAQMEGVTPTQSPKAVKEPPEASSEEQTEGGTIPF